jgi:hypothetical protein
MDETARLADAKTTIAGLSDALARADLQRIVALLVMIGQLKPEMPIAEALEMVPEAADYAG